MSVWCGLGCRPPWPTSLDLAIPLACEGDAVARLVASALDRSGRLEGIRGRNGLLIPLVTGSHWGVLWFPTNGEPEGLALRRPGGCAKCLFGNRFLREEEAHAIRARTAWEDAVGALLDGGHLETVEIDEFQPPSPSTPARHLGIERQDGSLTILAHETVGGALWAPPGVTEETLREAFSPWAFSRG